MRRLAILIAALLYVASAASDQGIPQPTTGISAQAAHETAPALGLLSDLFPAPEQKQPAFSQVQAAACCKICRKGKACGDSCISRDKTCRKGPGPAISRIEPNLPICYCSTNVRSIGVNKT